MNTDGSTGPPHPSTHNDTWFFTIIRQQGTNASLNITLIQTSVIRYHINHYTYHNTTNCNTTTNHYNISTTNMLPFSETTSNYVTSNTITNCTTNITTTTNKLLPQPMSCQHTPVPRRDNLLYTRKAEDRGFPRYEAEAMIKVPAPMWRAGSSRRGNDGVSPHDMNK